MLIQHNPPPHGAVLALGVFDGVHLGHQELVVTARRLAQENFPTHTPVGAVSFWPHPQKLFAPQRPFYQLTTAMEQAELMASLGVDYFGYFHFTPEFAAISAFEFAEKILAGQLAVRGVVVGFNFRYGAGNQGDAGTLEAAGRRYGFQVKVVEAVCLDGEVISSTRIRKLVAKGEVAAARRLLGRPYFVTGRVVHGYGRGHKLGFPTVNLRLPEDRVPPAAGVYAGRAVLGQALYRPCAIFVGEPVTFGNQGLSVEAHLLNWEGDLYEQELKLEFFRYLRPIIKFASPEELQRQIKHDIQRILTET